MSRSTARSRTAAARRRSLVLAIALLTGALLLGTVALGGGGGSAEDRGTPAGTPAEVSAPEATPQGPDISRRQDGDAYALGRTDAPVVLIEYADFQCPFCGKFARDTAPELIEKYVGSGVLRIEWRHFPVFGSESEAAARAGWAAGRQQKFWEFHDALYAEPRQRNSGAFGTDRLVALAREAGVPDLERFRRELTGEAAERAVERDRQEGYGLGVSSTPAFLINGRPILGAQPTETFIEVIEEARAGAAG